MTNDSINKYKNLLYSIEELGKFMCYRINQLEPKLSHATVVVTRLHINDPSNLNISCIETSSYDICMYKNKIIPESRIKIYSIDRFIGIKDKLLKLLQPYIELLFMLKEMEVLAGEDLENE